MAERHEIEDILIDTPYLRCTRAKGHQQGLAEGMAEGRAKGREEGQLMARRRSILQILTLRFSLQDDRLAFQI